MNSSSGACPPGADDTFGPTVQGCRDDFDFTLTFEQAFFAIAPSAIFLLAASGRAPFLLQRRRVAEANSFKWAKLGTIAVFSVLQLALVVLWSTRPHLPAKSTGIAAAAIAFVASIAMGILSPLEHAKALRPSTILCSYLLLTLLFDAAVLRTFWIFSFDEQVRRLFTASFTLKGIILLLEAKEKRNFVSSEHDKLRSPEEFSGIYGKSLYWWLNALIRNGFRHILGPDELYPLSADLQAGGLDERFWNGWRNSTRTSKHKLSFVLLNVLKWEIFLPVVPKLINLAFTFCQPLLLQRFLDYLQNPDERSNANVGYGLIGAYFLVYFGIALSSGIYWLLTYQSLTMLRGMLVASIYQKTTLIGLTAVDNAKAMTLMGTDAERIIRGLSDFHELWSSIVQVALATWLLETQLGAAATGPVAVCLISVGATVWAGTITTKRQLAWITAIEARIGMTSSVLGAMKSVRLSGLAAKVSTVVHSLRLSEIKNARRFWFLGAFSSTIGLVPQMVSPVVTFAIFTANGVRKSETLDFSRMFTSLAFLILLTQPLFNLFGAIIDFVAALGCFERINNYLAADSREDRRRLTLSIGKPSETSKVENSVDEVAIELKNVTGSWSKGPDAKLILRDMSLRILKSRLTFIAGPIASGKSTLLKAMLSELPSSTGEIFVSSKEMAFCDQTPWLINATIRENITAFSTFRPEYYQRVLRACALESDLRELPGGDATKVGSKGFSLSSGQKQRIALARAVYSRKDVMLFDDVLSQLDAPTQAHIFAHLFGPGGLLRMSKASIVLATHAVYFLPFADNIVILNVDGTIEEQGTYDELRNREEGYVHNLYRDHKIEEHPELPVIHPSADDIDNTKPALVNEDDEDTQKIPGSTDSKGPTSARDKARQLGDFEIYVYYFSCLGWLLTFGFFLWQAAFAFFTVFPNIWLEWWAESNGSNPNAENARYAGGYAGLQAAGLVSSGVLTWFSFGIMAQKAGLELHVKILGAIMRAPMSLFSTTDTGSITTKFSQDFQLVDSTLPLALMCVVTNLFISIGQAGLIASASAWIAISFPVLILVFYVVQRYYLRTSRQMRLLDLEQKAPLYTQFTESIEGIATLRAFGWQSQSISNNHTLVDNSQKPFYLLFMIQKWLSLVLDLIITALAVLVVGIAVGLRNTVSVGFTGVSLSQIISFTGYMKLIILFWTQMETSLGAVSRIRAFSDEAGDENEREEGCDPPTSWPRSGAADIKALSVIYKTAEATHTALQDVTLNISPGTKVAICGRTGSGKTTLLLALLKLVDTEGTMEIDGTDLSSIPREVLRKKIIAVSDEPFFFPNGTLRQNLDPLACCSDDAALKQILVDVMLWDVFSKEPEEAASATPKKETSDTKTPAIHELATERLSATFTPDTLSHGQKQLFAIARAIVRQSAKGPGAGGLVILDEATSRTDKGTDAIIQRVIRDRFSECTLIIIAHRLESILDFDRIAVLESGRLVEYDAPDVLRMKEDGVFRRMLGKADEEDAV